MRCHCLKNRGFAGRVRTCKTGESSSRRSRRSSRSISSRRSARSNARRCGLVTRQKCQGCQTFLLSSQCRTDRRTRVDGTRAEAGVAIALRRRVEHTHTLPERKESCQKSASTAASLVVAEKMCCRSCVSNVGTVQVEAWLGATVVDRKGASNCASSFLTAYIKSLRFKRILVRSDNERSLLSLIEHVMKFVQMTSPEGDHAANGLAEVGVREIKAQTRIMRSQLEQRLCSRIDEEDPLIPWIPRHAVNCVSRYKLMDDGRTLDQRRPDPFRRSPAHHGSHVGKKRVHRQLWHVQSNPEEPVANDSWPHDRLQKAHEGTAGKRHGVNMEWSRQMNKSIRILQGGWRLLKKRSTDQDMTDANPQGIGEGSLSTNAAPPMTETPEDQVAEGTNRKAEDQPLPDARDRCEQSERSDEILFPEASSSVSSPNARQVTTEDTLASSGVKRPKEDNAYGEEHPPARKALERRANRALQLVQMGELSSARHALEGAEIAPGSQATLQALTNEDRRPAIPREPLPQHVIDSVPAVELVSKTICFTRLSASAALSERSGCPSRVV